MWLAEKAKSQYDQPSPYSTLGREVLNELPWQKHWLICCSSSEQRKESLGLPKASSEDYKAHLDRQGFLPPGSAGQPSTLINLTHKPQIVVDTPRLTMSLLLYTRLFEIFSHFLDQELSGGQLQSSEDPPGTANAVQGSTSRPPCAPPPAQGRLQATPQATCRSCTRRTALFHLALLSS